MNIYLLPLFCPCALFVSFVFILHVIMVRLLQGLEDLSVEEEETRDSIGGCNEAQAVPSISQISNECTMCQSTNQSNIQSVVIKRTKSYSTIQYQTRRNTIIHSKSDPDVYKMCTRKHDEH